MLYRKLHTFIIVYTDGRSAGIGSDIVVVKNSRPLGGFEIPHPGITEGKAHHKGTQIVILQHKDFVGGMLLELLCHRNDIYLKAFRLCQLAESEKDIVGKVMLFLIFHIFDDDTKLPGFCFLAAKLCIAHFHSRVQNGFS